MMHGPEDGEKTGRLGIRGRNVTSVDHGTIWPENAKRSLNNSVIGVVTVGTQLGTAKCKLSKWVDGAAPASILGIAKATVPQDVSVRCRRTRRGMRYTISNHAAGYVRRSDTLRSSAQSRCAATAVNMGMNPGSSTALAVGRRDAR